MILKVVTRVWSALPAPSAHGVLSTIIVRPNALPLRSARFPTALRYAAHCDHAAIASRSLWSHGVIVAIWIDRRDRRSSAIVLSIPKTIAMDVRPMAIIASPLRIRKRQLRSWHDIGDLTALNSATPVIFGRSTVATTSRPLCGRGIISPCTFKCVLLRCVNIYI